MIHLPSEDDSKAEIVEHFGARLFQVFSYFFFSVEFQKDEKFLEEFTQSPGPDIRGVGLGIIQSACLNSTLVAIRDLDDFFIPLKTNSWKGDLKASDLGYAENLGFLATDEKKRISKIIVHSTDLAVKNWNASWDIQELTVKCVSQSLHFLDWVAANFPAKTHSKTLAAAIKCNQLTRMVLKYAARRSGSSAPRTG